MSIFNSIIVGIILSLTMFGIVQYAKVGSLKTDVENRDKAIQAYEQIIEVIPFNAMIGERSENANSKIDAALTNSSSVIDGTHRL